MDFTHTREYLRGGDTAVVKCSHKCHVRVTDDGDFQKYRNGFKYDLVGGYYATSSISIVVPDGGFWSGALDRGGAGLTVARDVVRRTA